MITRRGDVVTFTQLNDVPLRNLTRDLLRCAPRYR